jgi:thiol-disulfide isomerase/thioredoxin
MNKLLLIAGASFLVLLISFALYKFLCNKNQKTELFTDDKEYELVFFYATWCGHCTKFKPVWQEFKTEFEKDPKFAKVDVKELDIDEEGSKEYMEKYNVRGFPHVVCAKKDKSKESVFTKDRTKENLFVFVNEATN